MSSEIEELVDETLSEENVTHLRTDDGSLRYPISISDAIYMDKEETVNLTDYLHDMGTSTLFAKQIFAIQFIKDSDGYYFYEFQNPFNTSRVICNLRNTSGENLVCACTITTLNVKITLIEPEDCWVLLTGDDVGEVIVDGAGTDIASHSHVNKTTLDRLGNLDGRLTYNGYALAYESLIGDLSKINGTNVVDILLRICDMLDIDLGEADTPDIPKSVPVITSPSESIIRKYVGDTIIIGYNVVSDTGTNTLKTLIDNSTEIVEEINSTSGFVTVGPFEEGNHSVSLTVVDGNGLMSESLLFTLMIIEEETGGEVVAPELITSTSSILSFTDKDIITIDYGYSSPTENSTLYYSINGGNLEYIPLPEMDGMGEIQVGPLDAGNHTFVMYIEDGNSSISNQISISFVVDSTVGSINDIIINQFYSAGGKDDGPVSHNFIELYNTSERDVNIYNLCVQIGKAGNIWYQRSLATSVMANEETETLILPGHTSFFFLMNEGTPTPKLDLTNITVNGETHDLTTEYDNAWIGSVTASNKYCKIILTEGSTQPSSTNFLDHDKLIDYLVAANTDSLDQIEEGLYDICVQGLSKQKSVRRKEFTKDKSIDAWEIIDYRVEGNIVYAPRSMSCGAWTEVEQAVYGDDKIDPIGIAVVKLKLADDQVAKLKSGGKANGIIWYYNAKLGTRTINAFVEAKYQNYSGEEGNKENIKISLFSDESHDTEFDHKFDSEGFSGVIWPKLDGYVLKGGRKDPSHAHNVVTSNIIRQSYLSNHIITPEGDDTRYGIIDGFPIVLYINDEKQGIYTFTFPQQRKVYGIAKKDYKPAMFRGTSDGGIVHDSVRFKALCTDTSDEGYQWEDRYPEAYEDEALASVGETNLNNLNALIQWVMDTDTSVFYEELSEHMDVDYLIDYFIWCYFGGFTDSTANNFNLLSYDGKIYIPTFYDLDATFGLNHTGTAMLDTDTEMFTDYRVSDSLLWEKLFTSNASSVISRRYKKLRESTMNKEFILSEFDRFWALIPVDEQAADEAIWDSVLMGESGRFETHRAQLEAWLTERQKWCDTQLLGYEL